ncbi:conserved hypothetical protein [gamma proteobacterium HTCC5015]|nr:conserved hypothetical protein [gamma proteobacterium HTCC5015]
MQCFVYKSSKKQDMYIYLVEKDQFDCIPEVLREKFGTPIFALEFEFTEGRTLAKEDPATVRQNLETQGFHLQMPDDLDVAGPIDSKYH